MGTQFYRQYSVDEIKEAFAYFDKDNSGFITVDELGEVMSKMGRHFSKTDLDRMIRTVDTDGNGKIEINEFAKLLN
jgi:Ca2+-binding EF-hand superfamily protein